MSATVDIVDVYPEAIRVRAQELQKGDKVFDAFGGRYELTRVAVGRRSTRYRRQDGYTDSLSNDATITIVRGA